ncbi:MAG: hypothetical protein OKBPIBMD_01940 [Chlorobi bacterium]|nr:hypothetical protein [Chlorobiota bacterium]
MVITNHTPCEWIQECIFIPLNHVAVGIGRQHTVGSIVSIRCCIGITTQVVNANVWRCNRCCLSCTVDGEQARSNGCFTDTYVAVGTNTVTNLSSFVTICIDVYQAGTVRFDTYCTVGAAGKGYKIICTGICGKC